MPVEPSANRVISFGFDREVDLAQSLEGSFKERIDMGFIKTDETPGTGPPTLSAHRVGRAREPTTYGPSAIPRPLGADARLVTPPDSSRTTVAPPVALAARFRLLRVGEPPSA